MTTGFGDYTIEIEADVAKLLSGQRAADAALKQIETSVKRAGNSAEKLDKSLDKLGGGFSRLAVAVKGYISIQALMKLQQLSEEFTLLQARVTRLSSSSEEGARSFQQLVNIASATGASLGDTVNLWQQLTATLKTVGATNSDVNRLVMTLQKIGTIGGSSAQEMANALRQFMQSVASGRIQAEEFNSVLEQMPELARQIADGMGIPFNELRQLMLAGKLDIGEVLAAIEKRSDEINQQFETMPRTVSQATNALITQFGTNTPRDFVEFPSQIFEHWASQPQVFAHYAKHYQSGEPMPQALRDNMLRAATFNKGYDMSELLAAALLDMRWHSLSTSALPEEVDAFEQLVLREENLDLAAVPPRYRSSYFSHIFGGGYAAGYYAYLWTQMLADDGYQWFVEQGGLTRENGQRFREAILSRGNSTDLAELYRQWRGHDPQIEPMLKNRGLSA